MSVTDGWAKCPRCGKPMNPRDYPALSRCDDKTHVCGNCGVEEAIEVWFRGTPTPMADWPIVPTLHVELSDGRIKLHRPIPKPRPSAK